MAIIAWLRGYFEQQPTAKGAVIGISGGKDSAVCAGLLVNAIGADCVLGVSLPNGEQKDVGDAHRVANELGIRLVTVNIAGMNKALQNSFEWVNGHCRTDLALVNSLPRMRMTALYTLANMYQLRVCGTTNASEKFVGFTSKWGDTACDFNPILNYTMEEVVAIGKHLGLPEDICDKIPSSGLDELTDEEALGISYSDIHKMLRGRADEVPLEVRRKIMERHKYHEHKYTFAANYMPLWLHEYEA